GFVEEPDHWRDNDRSNKLRIVLNGNDEPARDLVVICSIGSSAYPNFATIEVRTCSHPGGLCFSRSVESTGFDVGFQCRHPGSGGPTLKRLGTEGSVDVDIGLEIPFIPAMCEPIELRSVDFHLIPASHDRSHVSCCDSHIVPERVSDQ